MNDVHYIRILWHNSQFPTKQIAWHPDAKANWIQCGASPFKTLAACTHRDNNKRRYLSIEYDLLKFINILLVDFRLICPLLFKQLPCWYDWNLASPSQHVNGRKMRGKGAGIDESGCYKIRMTFERNKWIYISLLP